MLIVLASTKTEYALKKIARGLTPMAPPKRVPATAGERMLIVLASTKTGYAPGKIAPTPVRAKETLRAMAGAAHRLKGLASKKPVRMLPLSLVPAACGAPASFQPLFDGKEGSLLPSFPFILIGPKSASI
jgi:hypothetical protein